MLVALAIAAVVAEPEAEAKAGAPLPYFGPPYQPNYYANPKKLVAHPAVPVYGYYGHPYHYGHYLGKRSDYELDLKKGRIPFLIGVQSKVWRDICLWLAYINSFVVYTYVH